MLGVNWKVIPSQLCPSIGLFQPDNLHLLGSQPGELDGVGQENPRIIIGVQLGLIAGDIARAGGIHQRHQQGFLKSSDIHETLKLEPGIGHANGNQTDPAVWGGIAVCVTWLDVGRGQVGARLVIGGKRVLPIPVQSTFLAKIILGSGHIAQWEETH